MKKMFYLSLVSYSTLVIICLLDIYTGYDINVGILYLVPFYFYCINYSTSKRDCIVFAIVLSISWTLGNILTFHVYNFNI